MLHVSQLCHTLTVTQHARLMQSHILLSNLQFFSVFRFTLTPSVGKNELGQPTSWTSEMKQLSKKNIDFTSVNPKVSGRKVRRVFEFSTF